LTGLTGNDFSFRLTTPDEVFVQGHSHPQRLAEQSNSREHVLRLPPTSVYEQDECCK
jgi:hypothetical protein